MGGQVHQRQVILLVPSPPAAWAHAALAPSEPQGWAKLMGHRAHVVSHPEGLYTWQWATFGLRKPTFPCTWTPQQCSYEPTLPLSWGTRNLDCSSFTARTFSVFTYLSYLVVPNHRKTALQGFSHTNFSSLMCKYGAQAPEVVEQTDAKSQAALLWTFQFLGSKFVALLHGVYQPGVNPVVDASTLEVFETRLDGSLGNLV